MNNIFKLSNQDFLYFCKRIDNTEGKGNAPLNIPIFSFQAVAMIKLYKVLEGVIYMTSIEESSLKLFKAEFPPQKQFIEILEDYERGITLRLE